MSEFVCIKDFEEHAQKVLPKNAWDYYRSGAGQETTLSNNQQAFNRIRIRPRCLTNVLQRDHSTIVLGSRVSMPIGIAPTAMQRMAHPEGELANVRAAGAYKTIFIQSTISTSSIEEVSKASNDAIKWFQLYIYSDRQVTLELIRRAENSAFKAIVLTVDTPFFGVRFADIRNKFTLPSHLKLANFDGEKAKKINTTRDGISGLNNYVNGMFDSSLSWKDVKWLVDVTHLPVVLKGILTAEDALIAADCGVAGIIVSNHGARQLDGTPASIEALPEIAQAVGNRIEVYMDGGVTDGTDVFKALALGARMVFIGRPALWGLAHSGEEGVKRILDLLKGQFDSVLAMTGCKNVSEISKNHVRHESFYHKL